MIADSVNPWSLTRKEWIRVAEEIGAKFVNVEVICSDEREHRNRVENRSAPVPGLRASTWQDVFGKEIITHGLRIEFNWIRAVR